MANLLRMGSRAMEALEQFVKQTRTTTQRYLNPGAKTTKSVQNPAKNAAYTCAKPSPEQGLNMASRGGAGITRDIPPTKKIVASDVLTYTRDGANTIIKGPIGKLEKLKSTFPVGVAHIATIGGVAALIVVATQPNKITVHTTDGVEETTLNKDGTVTQTQSENETGQGSKVGGSTDTVYEGPVGAVAHVAKEVLGSTTKAASKFAKEHPTALIIGGIVAALGITFLVTSSDKPVVRYHHRKHRK